MSNVQYFIGAMFSGFFGAVEFYDTFEEAKAELESGIFNEYDVCGIYMECDEGVREVLRIRA